MVLIVYSFTSLAPFLELIAQGRKSIACSNVGGKWVNFVNNGKYRLLQWLYEINFLHSTSRGRGLLILSL